MAFDLLWRFVMLFTVVVEVSVTIMLFNRFFKKKSYPPKVWLAAELLAIMAISYVNYNVSSLPLTSFLVLCVIFALSYLYEGYFKHRILITTLLWSLFLFSEFITFFFILGTTSTSTVAIFVKDATRFKAIVISKIFLFILAKGVLRFKKNSTEQIPTSYWLLLMAIPLFSVYTISVIYTLVPDHSSWQMACGLICVGLLMCNLVIFYLFESVLDQMSAKAQCHLLTQQLQHQVNYYHHLEQTQKDLTCFRHDLKNHLLTLGGLLQTQAYSEALRYLNTINQMAAPPKCTVQTGNPIFDALLNEKIKMALEQGIQVRADITLPQTLRVALVDWSIIFGNALDNAIEACLNISHGPRTIQIAVTYKHHNLICVVANSTNGQLLSQGSSFATTKANQGQHGLGLGNIAAAVARYNGNMTTRHENKRFQLEIVLYEV